jgi:phytoene dehydrogenase-like protein
LADGFGLTPVPLQRDRGFFFETTMAAKFAAPKPKPPQPAAPPEMRAPVVDPDPETVREVARALAPPSEPALEPMVGRITVSYEDKRVSLPPPPPPAPAAPPRYFRVMRTMSVPRATGGHTAGLHYTLPEGKILRSGSYDIEALRALGVPLEETSETTAALRAQPL